MLKTRAPIEKNVLQLKQRISVINDYDSGVLSARVLATKYNCSRNQIRNILKVRTELLALYNATYRCDNNLPPVTTTTTATIQETIGYVPENISDTIGVVLYEWCRRSRAHGIQKTEPLLGAVARNIAPLLGAYDFTPTVEWLNEITQRYDFSFADAKPSNGEGDAVESLRYTDIMDELGIEYDSRNLLTGPEAPVVGTIVADASNQIKLEYPPNYDEEDQRTRHNHHQEQEEVAQQQDFQEFAGEAEMIEQRSGLVEAVDAVNGTDAMKEIDSYREALNILGPLERFALFTENVRAVGLINQLEIIFREELENQLEAKGKR